MNYSATKKLDEESARKMQEGTGPVDECICHLLAPPDGERMSIGASIKKAFASITPGMPGKKRTEGERSPGKKITEAEGLPGMKKTGGEAMPGMKRTGGEALPGMKRTGGEALPGMKRTGGEALPGKKKIEREGLPGKKTTVREGLPSKKRRNIVGPGGVDIPIVFSKGEQGIYSTKEVVKRKGSCGKCGCDKEKIVMKHSFANIRITSPDVSSICPCPTNCLPEKTKLAMNNIKVTIERVTIDPDSENSEASLHHHKQQKILKEPVMTDRKSVTSLINAQYETDEDKLYD